jgi:hypothetical protein
MANITISPAWNMVKTPRFNTIAQETVAMQGNVYVAGAVTPVWDFKLSIPYLTGRIDDPTSVVAGLLGLFVNAKGRAGTFTFYDSRDHAVTNYQFGTGDGSSQVFQLTRPIGAASEWVQNVVGTPSIFINGTQVSANIIPDANGTGVTWTGDSLLVFSATGGAVTGGKWTYTGTGSASGFRIRKSTTFTVVPGATYTLSGYIDATHVTSIAGGSPSWLIYDPTITTQYGFALQSLGVNGRVTGTFTVPLGVTQVVALSDTGNCTVANAQPLVFSDPQLELGSSASAYAPRAFTMDDKGVITFDIAPANAAVLSWSGDFQYLLRMKDDSLQDLTLFFENSWSISTLAFESVVR